LVPAGFTAAFFTAAFLAAGSVTRALVLGAVLRAVAATARAGSAGRFSDELDDTNYLSSDAGFVRRYDVVVLSLWVLRFAAARWSGGGNSPL
jgi:hypothetical protein